MAYSKEVYQQAEQVLAQRRKDAATLYEKRRAEISRKIPRAGELLQKLSSTGLSVVRLAISKDPDVPQKLEELKRQNLQSQQELRRILAGSGYPAQYLDYPWHCSSCEDTGYIGINRCQCAEKLLRDIALRQMNTALRLTDFDTFRLDYYPTEPVDDTRVIPREKMKGIYSFCRQYAENFHPHASGILMIGPTGLGKTHLSLAIAREVTAKGYGVLYLSAQSLLSALEKERFQRDAPETDTMALACSCDLLLIDDLGSEFQTQFTQSALYQIINARMMAELPTILSTNYTLAEIQDRYTERILSRMIGSCEILKFVGRDIRQLKRLGKK